MKAFILFSLLSFASAIALIPSDGNMTGSESTHSSKYNEIDNKTFKLNDTCYKYKSVNVPCNNTALEEYQGNSKPSNEITEKGFMDKLFA